MPIIELVAFPGSDAFVKDRSVFKPGLETLVKTNGCISTYHGLQIEDERTGYLVVVWETYEHHKKLMEREDYGQLLQDLKPVASGPLEVQHVEFNKDPTAVFTSPVAEFATLKVKPGISQEAFLLALEALAEAVVKAPACHSVVFGETREHRGVWVALLGWDSLEAHREAAKNSDVGLQKLAGDLVAVSEMVVGHTTLVKFSG